MDQTNIESLNEYVLIKIFNFLNINDKLNCTRICRNWKRILNSSICQPKQLSITLNSDIPFTELNCDHLKNELINQNSTFNLINFNPLLLEDGLFTNLNLLILNFIFIDYSPCLDLSKLISLKHVEIHGQFEFVNNMICTSVEHIYMEKFKSNISNYFPNLKCLNLNQLKLESNDKIFNKSIDKLYKQLSNQETTSIQLNQCNNLINLKINYLPVQLNNNQIDLIQLLAYLTPNLEQLYMCLNLCEQDKIDFDDEFDNELNNELNNDLDNELNNESNNDLNIELNNELNIEFDNDSNNELNSNSKLNLSNLNNSNNSNINTTNCIINKIINLVKNLKNLTIINIEFDLDQMNNLRPINNFLLNLTYELSLLKLRLRIHFKFNKSLDLNSIDVIEFRNYLKLNSKSNLNEFFINGQLIRSIQSKYYHLINVEELYITNKDLNLFNKSTIYNYLKNVNTICFECNLQNLRFNELLSNLINVKYIYFDCPINQDQLNQLSIYKSNLIYLAIEYFNSNLDLEFLNKFNNLYSLYLGKIEQLNINQLIEFVQKSIYLNYLNIECRLIDNLLDHLINLFIIKAKKSSNFYHINLSLLNYNCNSLDKLQNLIKNNQLSNLKISFS